MFPSIRRGPEGGEGGGNMQCGCFPTRKRKKKRGKGKKARGSRCSGSGIDRAYEERDMKGILFFPERGRKNVWCCGGGKRKGSFFASPESKSD